MTVIDMKINSPDVTAEKFVLEQPARLNPTAIEIVAVSGSLSLPMSALVAYLFFFRDSSNRDLRKLE